MPDIRDGSVFYVDWSRLHHQKATSFTGGLVDFDLVAKQPEAFRQRVMSATLGVDLCP